ncbi:hypothetical protein N8467_01185 [bacterium]|nr:hypothetical protein [bacterium]
MSIIQKLSEGIVNRDMKKEGQALLTKWEATGLLEGLDTQQSRQNMARLLENQAKELLRESSAMAGTPGAVEGFASVAFPIVRRVFAGLIANELVSVQPMSLPSGLIFFLDFTYSGNIGAAGTLNDRFGNSAGDSIYGTDKVGSGIVDGVSIVGSVGENLSGPRQATGYAYASPSGTGTIAHNAGTLTYYHKASLTEAEKKLIQYDVDILSDSTITGLMILSGITEAELDSAADYDNLSTFAITVSGAAGLNVMLASQDTNMNTLLDAAGAPGVKQIRRLTDFDDSGELRFVFAATNTPTTAHATAEASAQAVNLEVSYPVKDTVAAGSAPAGAIQDYTMLMENTPNIPEIDIKVDSIAITAQTKKLKAKWTPELGQDLNAYHNLDAEVELTSILSEQIALEIDRELLADLVNGAKAATYYWSRSPGLFVNRSTGAELGASSAAPDFTGTVSEWYETLIETINDVSAQIHIKTLRGGANYVVVSPEVANILEFTSGFRANVTADADKGTIGAVKVGSLSRKFDIIVDPYFPRNAILVGRKGNSFLESGYVYAPYVPLQTTPTIFGVEDFVPRKGVMTRYAKKMVRPDMYGLVIVRGLLGEEGSS